MVSPEARLALDPEFRRGVELFNAREFYECHEVLEDLWRPTRGEPRLFLQAVIHFAVGFYHHRRGNQTGAELQLRKALRKLAGYLPEYAGIDTERLSRQGREALATIRAGGTVAEFPSLRAAGCGGI
jgi:predicted metal-dependent hydrolase